MHLENVDFAKTNDSPIVAWYQPETVLAIFNRAIFNEDVASGKIPLASEYSTTGPASSYGFKDKLPPSNPVDICYLWSLGNTCTKDQLLAVEKGTAEIVDYRIVSPAGGGGPISK